MNRGLSMDPCQWKKTTLKQGVDIARTNGTMITTQYRSVSLTEAEQRVQEEMENREKHQALEREPDQEVNIECTEHPEDASLELDILFNRDSPDRNNRAHNI